MKMSKELYNELKTVIEKTIVKHGIDVIKKHRQNVNFVKDQFISFCWSMYNASKFGENNRGIYDTLNDDHIETALKRILAEFA